MTLNLQVILNVFSAHGVEFIEGGARKLPKGSADKFASKRKMTVDRVPRRIMLVGVLAGSLFASNVAGAETLMMTCTQWLEARQRPDQGASTPEMAYLITKFRARTFVVADSIDVVCRKWPFLLWEPALRVALRLTTLDVR